MPAVFLLGIGSCTPTLQEICYQQLPQFQGRVVELASRLEWTNRKIASGDPKAPAVLPVSPYPKIPEVTASDLEGLNSYEQDKVRDQAAFSVMGEWLNWSRDSLAEVQKAIDLLETNPNWIKERHSLSLVANELVMFYSYAYSQKWAKMFDSLKRIELGTQKVKEGVCNEVQASRVSRKGDSQGS